MENLLIDVVVIKIQATTEDGWEKEVQIEAFRDVKSKKPKFLVTVNGEEMKSIISTLPDNFYAIAIEALRLTDEW